MIERPAAAWSVHACPKCGHALNLSDIDLRTITTGIVNRPHCDWSGPIEIQVFETAKRPNERRHVHLLLSCLK
jgi:hypothetical protein